MKVLSRLAAVLLAACAVVLAFAQGGYPDKPIRVIVPFPPGGGTDTVARAVAAKLTESWKVPVVVDNRPGGNTLIGAEAAARAAPDGYTLALGHMGTHAAAIFLTANLAYDPRTDFEPIGLMSTQPVVLATRKGFPANNLKEFVTYAKANADKLNMAHAGIGSVSHTSCLILHHEIGIKTTMVPFTGTAPVLNAMLGEQVDYVCDPILGPLSHIRAGTLKAMAVATEKRHPLLPDTPSSTESGLPGFQAAPFYAIFAPKGTPQPIVAKLADALSAGLDDPAVAKRFGDLGAVITEKKDRGPAPLAAMVKSEIDRLAPILKVAGQ